MTIVFRSLHAYAEYTLRRIYIICIFLNAISIQVHVQQTSSEQWISACDERRWNQFFFNTTDSFYEIRYDFPSDAIFLFSPSAFYRILPLCASSAWNGNFLPCSVIGLSHKLPSRRDNFDFSNASTMAIRKCSWTLMRPSLMRLSHRYVYSMYSYCRKGKRYTTGNKDQQTTFCDQHICCL